MGQANEKVARVQDSYVAAASESWLEALERSLAQMKEYQVSHRYAPDHTSTIADSEPIGSKEKA